MDASYSVCQENIWEGIIVYLEFFVIFYFFFKQVEYSWSIPEFHSSHIPISATKTFDNKHLCESKLFLMRLNCPWFHHICSHIRFLTLVIHSTIWGECAAQLSDLYVFLSLSLDTSHLHKNTFLHRGEEKEKHIFNKTILPVKLQLNKSRPYAKLTLKSRDYSSSGPCITLGNMTTHSS